MAGQGHRSYKHEFDQTLGGSGRQEGLACSGPWGHRQSDTTKRQRTMAVLYHPGTQRPQTPCKTKTHTNTMDLMDDTWIATQFKKLVLLLWFPRNTYTLTSFSVQLFFSNIFSASVTGSLSFLHSFDPLLLFS